MADQLWLMIRMREEEERILRLAVYVAMHISHSSLEPAFH